MLMSENCKRTWQCPLGWLKTRGYSWVSIRWICSYGAFYKITVCKWLLLWTHFEQHEIVRHCCDILKHYSAPVTKLSNRDLSIFMKIVCTKRQSAAQIARQWALRMLTSYLPTFILFIALYHLMSCFLQLATAAHINIYTF